MRILLGPLMLAFGFTLFLTLISSVIPIRWDYKTLAPNLPQIAGNLPLSGHGIVYVSADESWQNHHLARYGLDFLTFPDGEDVWLVFWEGVTNSPASADYAIDQTGQFHANHKSGGWQPVATAPPDLEEIARHGTLLLSSPDLLEPLAQRWPLVRFSSVRMVQQTKGSFLAKPQLRSSLTSFVRTWWLLTILLACFAATAIYNRQRNRPSGELWLACCFVVPCWLAAHTSLVYLLGWLTPRSVPAALGLQSAVLLTALLLLAARSGTTVIGSGALARIKLSIYIPVILALLAFYVSSIMRLDFDGDLFTHWIPSARFHHLLGHHDPSVLFKRYGAAHEATYPPGFPIFISTLMWIADVPRESSFQLGYESHQAILLYRTFLVALQLAFMAGVAAFFKIATGHGNHLGWLVPTLVVPLILPLFLGKPVSSEVYLVPILGFSILAFAYAGLSENAGFARLGLVLSFFGLFLKNDVILSLPMILLPWYLVYLAGSKNLNIVCLWKDLAAVFITLLPWLIWRVDLGSLNIATNFMFESVTLSKLIDGLSMVMPLAQSAIKIIVAGNFWLVLFVALPASAVYQFMTQQRRYALVIPVGIWLFAAGLILIYVFSRSNAIEHLNTSYSRLLMIAVLSGIIYCGQELFAAPLRISQT